MYLCIPPILHHFCPDGTALLQPGKCHLSFRCDVNLASSAGLCRSILWFLWGAGCCLWMWRHTHPAVSVCALLQVSYYRWRNAAPSFTLSLSAAVGSGVGGVGDGRRRCRQHDWWVYFENIPSRACLRPGDWMQGRLCGRCLCDMQLLN